MRLSSSEKQLARELASTLNDWGSLELYEVYALNYQEAALRTILTEVMSVPEQKIKKSRAALFTFLVKKYGNRANNHRN
jgi:hypothetical protein